MTLAEQCDRHDLYQRSVQSPQHDAALLQRLYRQARGASAHHLREDFCGSAATLRAWLAQGADFTGEGYDIDPDALDWAARHHFRNARVRRRVNLRAADARARSRVAPDIRCAFNFSYWIFRERTEMLDYFRTARDDLGVGGVLALDLHGGGEAFSEEEQVTDCGDFEVVCHQTDVCPVDHSANLALHFRFPDGSQMRDAFRYRWRIWSLPEIADLLREAGFADIRVHWCIEEGDDCRYEMTRFGHNDPAWLACLAALK
ncbi:MAG: class I SAM-dependent methyltransferase [bacterium]